MIGTKALYGADELPHALREYAQALAAAGRSEADAAFEEAGQQIRRMSGYGPARSASRELAITLIRNQCFQQARKLVDMFQLKEFIDVVLEVIPVFESDYQGITVDILQGLSGVGAWVMPQWRQINETLSGTKTS